MLREFETSTKVTVCLALILVGIGVGAVTSRWTIDWIGKPHLRATVTDCHLVYEVPRPGKRCYADTADGPLYILGAGQHHEGDVSYVWTTHKIRSAQPVPFAPATADYAFLALASVPVVSGLIGIAVLVGRTIRRRVKRHESDEVVRFAPQ